MYFTTDIVERKHGPISDQFQVNADICWLQWGTSASLFIYGNSVIIFLIYSESESRARHAEERALAAESALVEALDRLRALEQQAQLASPSLQAAPASSSSSVVGGATRRPAGEATSTIRQQTMPAIFVTTEKEKSFHRPSSKMKNKKK